MKSYLTLFILVFLINIQLKCKEQYILTLHHFMSPNSFTHKNFLIPWVKKIEEQSNNKIKIEIFPSMTLGGKPAELYRQARDGFIDITWTVAGYTPGVFLRSEVFELPIIHRGSAKETNILINKNLELIKEDYKSLKPLLIHVHSGATFFLVDKQINALEQFNELKVRTPSRTGAWLLSYLNVKPVGMPLPDLPAALSKNVVDGALIPYEILKPLRLEHFVNIAYEGRNKNKFGTSVFIFAMNLTTYKKLPKDLQDIIENNSGANIAENTGLIWDKYEETQKKYFLKSGGKVLDLNSNILSKIDDAYKSISKKWLTNVKKKGVDGDKIINKLLMRK